MLSRIWLGGVTTKSDPARENADLIAALACQGMITTLCGPGKYDNVWKITPKGLNQIMEEFGHG